jgi:hypothetical protein
MQGKGALAQGASAQDVSGLSLNGAQLKQTVTSVVKNFHTVNCDKYPGYISVGVACVRFGVYHNPSSLVTCPSGYTNMGLTCYRKPSTYHNPSRLVTCPGGYTNMGFTCHKWWWPKSIPVSRGSCPGGYWKSAIGRCYRHCRSGYHSTGEFCQRNAKSIPVSRGSCPAGHSKSVIGRCYKHCKPGYHSTGEHCATTPDTIFPDSVATIIKNNVVALVKLKYSMQINAAECLLTFGGNRNACKKAAFQRAMNEIPAPEDLFNVIGIPAPEAEDLKYKDHKFLDDDAKVDTISGPSLRKGK